MEPKTNKGTPTQGGVMATKIAEVMTERPRAVTPETSVREAARLMEEEDVGSLPVVEQGARLVGMITDRDLAIRVVGHGLDPDTTTVGAVSSADLVALTPEHELDDVLRLMAREQVRRVPIVVGEDELVGIVAQADIARAGKEKSAGEVLEAISRPPRGPRVAGSDVSDSSERDEADLGRDEARPRRDDDTDGIPHASR
jgi:CBS domain-containing protein